MNRSTNNFLASQRTFFFLITIIVNLKNPKNSIKNPILPSSIQNSSQYISGFSNLLSRASSRVRKRVHSKERLQTYCIARHFSRSVFASSASRNPSSEVLSSSSLHESEEESIGSDSKIPTTPRVIIGKLFKRVPLLKLPTAFPEGKTFTIS